MIRRLLFSVCLIVVASGGFITLHTSKTYALTGSDWQAGSIIDDAVFTNANSMSVSDIQNFLNAQVPNCDTWGTQKATDWGRSDLTHAQFAALQGWPAPPYVCLKEYYEVPKTTPGAGVPDNSYNHYNASTQTLLPVPGGISAAQIIYNAAQQYQISPKVLLVKLQTESAGPLTQDTWPLPSQYTYALGSNCPDSGPNGSAQCDSNYSGFSMQVYSAANLLRTYLTNMTQSWWTHAKPYQNNNILWHDTGSLNCGSGSVFIKTEATAALYTYTPYQPNAAALANVSDSSSGGLGDSCSSYGNRNFWWWYNHWFGSTHNTPSQCDTSVAGVTCVWELMQPDGEYFYTTSIAERDAAINNGLNYIGIAFYARPNNYQGGPNEVPTYRVQKNGDHFWTSNAQTYQQYLASGWSDEGIAWYTDPAYSNTGNPIYMLNSPSNGSVYVSADKYASYISWGYTYAGETLNAPTKYIETSPTASTYQNVYRILQCNGNYMFTVSIPEVEAMVQDSCNHYEGTAFYSPVSTAANAVPVNRFNNNGRYIWTTSQAETTALTNAGWKNEGTSFYTYGGNSTNTVAVNRFSNNGRHIWTTSQAETSSLIHAGWTYEGIAFYAYDESGANTVAVNRFSSSGGYMWTTSQAETTALTNAGWTYEGIAFYAYNQGTANTVAVNRFNNNGRHIWTTSQAETTALTNAGWTYEGIAFYADSGGSSGDVPVNRFRGPSGKYIWTTSQAETTALTNAGWTYEGIAFYVANP